MMTGRYYYARIGDIAGLSRFTWGGQIGIYRYAFNEMKGSRETRRMVLCFVGGFAWLGVVMVAMVVWATLRG
jgi:hypothetical protein